MLKRYGPFKLAVLLILFSFHSYTYSISFDRPPHDYTQEGGIGAGVPKNSGIKDFIKEWVAMWNNYDLDQIGKLFLKSDDLSYFSSEKEGIIRGFKNILDHHIGFGFVTGGKKTSNRLWLDQINISNFKTWTIVTAIWYFQKNKGPTQRGPVTFVCLKKGSDYKFIHLNFGNYIKKK